jgi:hypothetical protein
LRGDVRDWTQQREACAHFKIIANDRRNALGKLAEVEIHLVGDSLLAATK